MRLRATFPWKALRHYARRSCEDDCRGHPCHDTDPVPVGYNSTAWTGPIEKKWVHSAFVPEPQGTDRLLLHKHARSVQPPCLYLNAGSTAHSSRHGKRKSELQIESRIDTTKNLDNESFRAERGVVQRRLGRFASSRGEESPDRGKNQSFIQLSLRSSRCSEELRNERDFFAST